MVPTAVGGKWRGHRHPIDLQLGCLAPAGNPQVDRKRSRSSLPIASLTMYLLPRARILISSRYSTEYDATLISAQEKYSAK